MNKLSNQKIEPKEFGIRLPCSKEEINISLRVDDLYICFSLSSSEWSNLLQFLKKTESKEYLPQHCLQYSEFDIDTDKYSYSDSRGIIQWTRELFSEVIMKPGESNLDKELAEITAGLDPLVREQFKERMQNEFQQEQERMKKQERKRLSEALKQERKRLKGLKEDAKKHLVAETIYLRKEGVITINMSRERFYRFREHCLSPKNHLTMIGTEMEIWLKRTPGASLVQKEAETEVWQSGKKFYYFADNRLTNVDDGQWHEQLLRISHLKINRPSKP